MLSATFRSGADDLPWRRNREKGRSIDRSSRFNQALFSDGEGHMAADPRTDLNRCLCPTVPAPDLECAPPCAPTLAMRPPVSDSDQADQNTIAGIFWHAEAGGRANDGNPPVGVRDRDRRAHGQDLSPIAWLTLDWTFKSPLAGCDHDGSLLCIPSATVAGEHHGLPRSITRRENRLKLRAFKDTPCLRRERPSTPSWQFWKTIK
jgi:hypothetical protein